MASNPYAPPQSSVADVGPSGGAITESMLDAMRGTKGWVLFIGVLLFVGAAFMVLASIAMIAGGAFMGAAMGAPQGATVALSGIYVVSAVIYIFLGLYLTRYSSAIGRLLTGGQAADLEDALQQQRKFWKLSGVLAVLFIVVFVIGMLAAILIPAFMR
jgi:hypothetical protein